MEVNFLFGVAAGLLILLTSSWGIVKKPKVKEFTCIKFPVKTPR